MTAEDRVETALRAPEQGRALRRLVQDLAREGMTKSAIYEVLETFVVHLRTRPDFDEAMEETVLDVMDAMTGECHPSAELLRDERV